MPQRQTVRFGLFESHNLVTLCLTVSTAHFHYRDYLITVIRLSHCQCLTACASLPLAHCHCATTTTSLPLPHCHCATAIASSPVPHYHYLITTTSLPLCHCLCLITTSSLPLCHWYCLITTAPLPLCHCHCFTATASLPLCYNEQLGAPVPPCPAHSATHTLAEGPLSSRAAETKNLAISSLFLCIFAWPYHHWHQLRTRCALCACALTKFEFRVRTVTLPGMCGKLNIIVSYSAPTPSEASRAVPSTPCCTRCCHQQPLGVPLLQGRRRQHQQRPCGQQYWKQLYAICSCTGSSCMEHHWYALYAAALVAPMAAAICSTGSTDGQQLYAAALAAGLSPPLRAQY